MSIDVEKFDNMNFNTLSKLGMKNVEFVSRVYEP